MKKINKTLLSMLALGLAASASAQDMINFNMVQHPQSGDHGSRWTQNITGTETFGLADYDGLGTSTVSDNWNNYDAVVGGTMSGLVDNSGATTTLGAFIGSLGGNTYGTLANNTAYKAGSSVWKNVTKTLTVSNVNSFATTYDLIVYVGIGGNTTDVIVGGVARSYSADATALSDYWVFEGLTADELVVSVQNSTSNLLTDNAAAFGGIQIIAIPEPGTYALIAGALALTAVMVRRRK